MHQGRSCGAGHASMSSAHEAVGRLPHEQARVADLACALRSSSLCHSVSIIIVKILFCCPHLAHNLALQAAHPPELLSLLLCVAVLSICLLPVLCSSKKTTSSTLNQLPHISAGESRLY